jgi:hypothetical protein
LWVFLKVHEVIVSISRSSTVEKEEVGGAPGVRNELGKRIVAAAAVVVKVRVVDTGKPIGISVAGAKLQAEPAGRPLQAKLVAEAKPA